MEPTIHNSDLFDTEMEKLGISLSDMQKEQFARYYELLTEWNKVMNLTGITEYEEVIIKHFADSLALVRICDIKNISTVIDVGTGAGFPGIPMKIAFPHLDIVLLDSLNKRLKFLDTVIGELGLEAVRTLHGRAEDHARKKEYRENFDLCVSRAVANLSVLSEYCIPFVKKGGSFISYKSGSASQETEQAKKAVYLLGGKITEIDSFSLPGTDIKRSLICITKVNNTPGQYPRKAGTPSKEPL